MGVLRKREASRRYFVEAAGTADQSIPTTTFTTLLNWSKVSDTTGCFDTSTGFYTCPVSGIYSCTFGLRADITTPMGVGINNSNNTDSARHFTWTEQTSAARRVQRHSHVARYLAGDTLRAYVYSDGAVSVGIGKYLGIYLVAAD